MIDLPGRRIRPVRDASLDQIVRSQHLIGHMVLKIAEITDKIPSVMIPALNVALRGSALLALARSAMLLGLAQIRKEP